MFMELTSVVFLKYESWFPQIRSSFLFFAKAYTSLSDTFIVFVSSKDLLWNQSPANIMFYTPRSFAVLIMSLHAFTHILSLESLFPDKPQCRSVNIIVLPCNVSM